MKRNKDTKQQASGSSREDVRTKEIVVEALVEAGYDGKSIRQVVRMRDLIGQAISAQHSSHHKAELGRKTEMATRELEFAKQRVVASHVQSAMVFARVASWDDALESLREATREIGDIVSPPSKLVSELLISLRYVSRELARCGRSDDAQEMTRVAKMLRIPAEDE